MSGGLINDSQNIAYQMTEAVTYSGLLLTYGTSGNWTLCDAGEEPLGFALMSNRDIRYIESDVILSSGSLDVHALIEGQEIEVRYTGTAPTVGQLVETDANGVVSVNSGAGWIVGMAIATGASNYVKIRVSKRYKAS